MMSCQAWPEPVVRVQALAESGLSSIPSRYVKPRSQRPTNTNTNTTSMAYPQVSQTEDDHSDVNMNIPVIDLQSLSSGEDIALREETLQRVAEACREWGFFQVVNHGVSHELMRNARELWREFFDQPYELKEEYANSPNTYEGYGSRLGVSKGAILDWSDYFFLHYMPPSLRNQDKWPTLPLSLRYDNNACMIMISYFFLFLIIIITEILEGNTFIKI
ncbi:hypothetical protein Ahy_B04g073045 isoform I [Arachis hypogaea]|uniref:Non-haem dioxygenase N-terminal domain-containing protein n=1 Tax=Arachis hypogaea TaxID=3818 RepID=A0A444ZPK2_ARAHY|nr:hypothetical protein Ahy_B04g073045 isoform I [Arachis hypogaea]